MSTHQEENVEVLGVVPSVLMVLVGLLVVLAPSNPSYVINLKLILPEGISGLNAIKGL